MPNEPTEFDGYVTRLKLYLETVEKVERRRKDLRGLIGKDGNSMTEEQAYTEELSNLTKAQNGIQKLAAKVAEALGKATKEDEAKHEENPSKPTPAPSDAGVPNPASEPTAAPKS